MIHKMTGRLPVGCVSALLERTVSHFFWDTVVELHIRLRDLGWAVGVFAYGGETSML
jgi:hypothetical protein